MDKGTIQAICGGGCGKTATALGKGILAVTAHKKVIMIQFLKGCLGLDVAEELKRLEPELKVFRFEKSGDYFENLTEAQKEEERMNIFNGINFARKVLTTGECDLLILDEVLGILDQNIVSVEEIRKLLELRSDDVSLIMTGKVFPKELEPMVDSVTQIENLEVHTA